MEYKCFFVFYFFTFVLSGTLEYARFCFFLSVFTFKINLLAPYCMVGLSFYRLSYFVCFRLLFFFMNVFYRWVCSPCFPFVFKSYHDIRSYSTVTSSHPVSSNTEDKNDSIGFVPSLDPVKDGYIISNFLNKISNVIDKNEEGIILSNNKNQRFIEDLILNDHRLHEEENVRNVCGIDTKVLSNPVAKYVKEKKDNYLDVYLRNLITSNKFSKKSNSKLIHSIFNSVGLNLLTSICISTFLLILSQHNTVPLYDDDDDDIHITPYKDPTLIGNGVRIGKNLLNIYLRNAMIKEFPDVDTRPKFSK